MNKLDKGISALLALGLAVGGSIPAVRSADLEQNAVLAAVCATGLVPEACAQLGQTDVQARAVLVAVCATGLVPEACAQLGK